MYKFLVKVLRVINFIFYGLKKPSNELVPEDGGLIICANHPGLYDPIFIAASLDRQLTFMSKKELFKNKLFGKFLSSVGAFPIDRGNNDIGALKTAIKLLKSGHALLMFPQVTRSKKADNNPAKHGAVRLAIMTGAKILPIGITDDHKLFKKAYVRIGEPIDLSEYKKEHLEEADYDRLSQELMSTIYNLAEGVNA